MYDVKSIVHPKMKILSSIIHSYFIPNPHQQHHTYASLYSLYSAPKTDTEAKNQFSLHTKSIRIAS